MNPVNGLLRSRKALVGVITVLLDTVLPPVVIFFVGKYAPFYLEDAKVVMIALAGLWTAIGGLLIGAIAYEDGKAKAAGAHPSQYYLKPPLDVPESDNME